MTSEELQVKAQEIFGDIVELTKGPQDAAELIFYLHLLLWRNQESPTTAVVMLDTFKFMFLEALGEGPGLQ